MDEKLMRSGGSTPASDDFDAEPTDQVSRDQQERQYQQNLDVERAISARADKAESQLASRAASAAGVGDAFRAASALQQGDMMGAASAALKTAIKEQAWAIILSLAIPTAVILFKVFVVVALLLLIVVGGRALWETGITGIIDFLQNFFPF